MTKLKFGKDQLSGMGIHVSESLQIKPTTRLN
jgi:hypothetical protein